MNEILVNFLVSASNELGKVWEETEEENLVPVVKIVKGTGEDSGRGSVHCEEGFLPFTQAFPNPLLVMIGFLKTYSPAGTIYPLLTSDFQGPQY